MVYMLVLFPLVMAVVTFAVPSGRWRPWLLPAGALVQLGLAAEAIFSGEGAVITGLGGWLLLDALGKLILGFLSVLFFLCSLYAPGYLALRADRPNRTFCANLFATLAMMTMVSLSHHLGLMWVAMEATTLTSAPLIYFRSDDHGFALSPLGADVGGDGGDDSHQRAVDLLQPQRSLAGGDLEIPVDRLRGHRLGPDGFLFSGLRVAEVRSGIDAA